MKVWILTYIDETFGETKVIDVYASAQAAETEENLRFRTEAFAPGQYYVITSHEVKE